MTDDEIMDIAAAAVFEANDVDCLPFAVARVDDLFIRRGR